jgi:hypothetical protein
MAFPALKKPGGGGPPGEREERRRVQLWGSKNLATGMNFIPLTSSI